MSKWGNCDYKQLEKLCKKLEKMAKVDVESFCKEVSKNLAARLLAKVIKRTPVSEGTFEIINENGVQKRYKIKNGGTLRRGWTATTQAQAEEGTVLNAKEYAESLRIAKIGKYYIIIIKNPVEYASYVEFGHRQEPGRFVPAIGKRLKVAWVPGQFMLTRSEKELETQIPKIIESQLKKFLEECFNNGY